MQQMCLSCCCIPKRYVIVLLAFFGYINMYCLRTNLSMAIVQMTSQKNITLENGTIITEEPEFNWDSKQKGFVLSAFSYGYLAAPLGGFLATKFGGGTIFGIGVLMTGVTTLFTQLVLYLHFYLFIASRVIEGLFEAFAFASVAELWSRWAPPNERSKFVSYSFTGIFIGTAVSFSISGFLIKLWGWPAVFYTNGIISVIWYVFWYLLVTNDPADDKCISNAEKTYILTKVKRNQEKVVIPWRYVLTSVPLWAACAAKFAFSCGHSITIMCLPQYIKDIHNIDIKQIGFISSIPHICAIVSYPLCGIIADYLRKNEIFTPTQVHKIYVTIGFLVGTVVFFIAGLWSNFIASIACMSMFKFFISFSELAIQVVALDMAPRFSALLSGITNSFLTMAAIVSPTVVGYIVTEHSAAQWNTCFILLSVVYILGIVVFVFFGSGKQQHWAMAPSEKENAIKFNHIHEQTKQNIA
ncbi:vesicular glutamate transporter 3-like [Planococcus citri]|uniref:vesicular glutamate transporter 3-like n=1 Tax=Planococcus citri TaxID=170843 RepID=UPI0031F8AF2E